MRRALFLSMVAVACGPQVRTVDVRSAADSVLFLVHLDRDDVVRRIDGPILVDASGVAEVAEQERLPAFFDRTEALSIRLEALQIYTADRDPTSRRSAYFTVSAPCWLEQRCALGARPTTDPPEYSVLTKPAESVGSIEFVPDAELLGGSVQDLPIWIEQVVLQVPFDMKLIEAERVQVFGEVEAWAQSLEPPGIIDFVPLDGGSVLLLTTGRACIAHESSSASEICAAGAQTLDLSDLGLSTATNWFVGVARSPSNGSADDVVYLSTTGTVSHIFTASVAADSFSDTAVIHRMNDVVTKIAVADDATLLAITEKNPNQFGGVLRGIEFPPRGPVRTTLVRWNDGLHEDGINEAKLTGTNDPLRPFVVGTINEAHLRTRDRNEPWLINAIVPDPTNAHPPKALAARLNRAELIDGEFMTWVGFNNGLLFRLESLNFGLTHMPLTMPRLYVQACEPTSADNFNQSVADIRALAVTSDHNGFVLVDGCAVVFRFDPKPLDTDPTSLAVSVYHAGDLDEPWPSIGGSAGERHLKEYNGDLWISGGAALRRLRLPEY